MKNKPPVPPSSVIAIEDVARLTGVSAHTLRAWEKRYRAVQPQRMGLRRVYSGADIERIQILRDLVESGIPIRKACRMNGDEIKKHLPSQAQPLEVLRAELIARIEKYELAPLAHQLRAQRLRRGVEEFLLDLVWPLLQDVGQLVESGRLGIAQEHALSALIRDQIIRIRSVQTRQGLPSMGFCTPEGDYHEFGILIAAKLAETRGFPVYYLGANLPADALVDVAQACSLRRVVIGTTPVPSNLRHFDAYLKRVNLRLKKNVQVWVAGAMAQFCLNQYGLAHRRGERFVPLTHFHDYLRELEALQVSD